MPALVAPKMSAPLPDASFHRHPTVLAEIRMSV